MILYADIILEDCILYFDVDWCAFLNLEINRRCASVVGKRFVHCSAPCCKPVRRINGFVLAHVCFLCGSQRQDVPAAICPPPSPDFPTRFCLWILLRTSVCVALGFLVPSIPSGTLCGVLHYCRSLLANASSLSHVRSFSGPVTDQAGRYASVRLQRIAQKGLSVSLHLDLQS